jgi:hypothetical protein
MRSCVAALLASILSVSYASVDAAVIEHQVTPKFIREHPKQLSVKVSRDSRGLLEFTVDREFGDREVYLVVTFKLHRGDALLAETVQPSYVYGGAQSFYFKVSPDCVLDSEIELSERSFAGNGATRAPLPGGADYKIRLEDFLPEPSKNGCDD